MPIPRKEIAGCILIGGKSVRMGQTKALVGLAGRPLWRHVADTLAALVDCVIFLGEAEGLVVPDGYRQIADDPGDVGPLGGILAGLEKSGYVHHLLVAVDYPLVRPALLSALLDKSDLNGAVCSRSELFLEPLVAYYSRDCAPAIRSMLTLGEIRTHQLFERVRSHVILPADLEKIDPAKWSLFNVNTPSDLMRAEAMLRAGYPQ